MKKTYRATGNDEGRNIYKFVTIMLHDVPLSLIQKIFRNKDVKVNGIRVDKAYNIVKDDLIEIFGVQTSKTRKDSALPQTNKMEFEIVFEDENIIVVDKPNGLVVHGTNDCLDAQVLKYLKYGANDSFIPSHIGRIDKETSGLMIYAKNYATLKQLKDKNEFIKKIYLFKSDLNDSLSTSLKLGHNEEKMKEEVMPWGKDSLTHFIVDKKTGEKTAVLVTGRKHQIRASLAHIKKPIYGDVKYGGKKASRMYLHAYKIIFTNLEGNLEYLNDKELIANIKW